jgi:hypothetical protein
VSALTTLNALRWWSVPILRFIWFAARWPLVVRLFLGGPELERLSFIHFARWVLVRRLPSSAGGRLRTPHLLFETNFNGGFDSYIEGFSHVLSWRLSNIWSGSPGFPGPRPVDPFKRFILRQEYPAVYYWSAYPEATTTEVTRALELRDRLRRFARETHDLEPEAFAERYARFITDAQLLL